jgi:hypothetical protein
LIADAAVVAAVPRSRPLEAGSSAPACCCKFLCVKLITSAQDSSL